MTRRQKDEEVGEKNREAEQMNPAKSGIRSGNPQLDPDSVHHEGERPRTPKLPRQPRRH